MLPRSVALAADLHCGSIFLLIIFIYRKFIYQFLMRFRFFDDDVVFEVDLIIFVLACKVKALIFQNLQRSVCFRLMLHIYLFLCNCKQSAIVNKEGDLRIVCRNENENEAAQKNGRSHPRFFND